MKLWLLTQTVQAGYDTYDSAVVAAETTDAARRIHPDEFHQMYDTRKTDEELAALGYCCQTWPSCYLDVNAEYIGEAKPGTEVGVVLASFNAA